MESSRDYAYYKEHAHDVNLEDITSSEQNKDILQKLRDGDSEFTGFYIIADEHYGADDEFYVVEGQDDLGWLGYFIGESKILKDLLVRINVTGHSFIEGVCRNQSIESLSIERDVGNYLSFGSIFKNNNRLTSLSLDSFNMNAYDFAVSLGQKSHLKCLHFHYMDFPDEEVSVIAKALIAQPQLEELKFNDNEFERNCCAAFKTTFMKWGRKSQLKKLDLTSNAIDDEGLTILLEGLVCCHNLAELTLSCSDLSAAGLRSLSSYLHEDSCCVEILNLDDVNMDDNGAEALASGLMHSESLKRLDLSRNLVDDTGIAALVSGLTAAANSNLEELYLSENQFSTAGIRSLSALIQSQGSSLKKLSLNRMQVVDDDGILILADALTNKTKLQSLVFEIGASNNAVAVKNKFEQVLCDTTSINNIYLSNHTLQSIGQRSDFFDGVNYFDLNRWRQKLEPEDRGLCPMIKILINYPDLAEMEPFYQWKLKFLPMIAGWFQKAGDARGYLDESVKKFQRREVSAMYKFIRGVPQLVADGYWSQRLKQVRLKKRKLEEEEKYLLGRLEGGKRALV